MVDILRVVSVSGNLANLSFCRKGLTALQRGARCMTTGTPLHDNGHAVADQRGPYGSAAELFSSENGAEIMKSRPYRRFFRAIFVC